MLNNFGDTLTMITYDSRPNCTSDNSCACVSPFGFSANSSFVVQPTLGRIPELPNALQGGTRTSPQGSLVQNFGRRKNRNCRKDRCRKIFPDHGLVPDPGVGRRLGRHRRRRHRKDRPRLVALEADHHPARPGSILRDPPVQHRPLPEVHRRPGADKLASFLEGGGGIAQR